MTAARAARVSQTSGHAERPVAVGLDRVRPSDSEGGTDVAWRRFCHRLAYGLDFLREHNPVVRSLDRGPWAILKALAPRWQGKREAFPSQHWIARYTGYSVRIVRDDVRELERVRLIELRRERQPNGHERIVYMPGQALLVGAVAFLATYPERARAPARPAAKSAGGIPAESAGELSDLSLQNRTPISSSLNRRSEPPPKQEERHERFTETDRDVARTALADLRAQRFPDRAPVPVFDAADVDMAALCAATIPGDAAAKSRAMTDAIAHAFESSKGPPSARYVWGTPDHFLAHEARGHERRVGHEAATLRAASTEAAARERDREWREQSREACAPPAELLRMFGLPPARSDLSAREAAPSPVLGVRQP